jgi:uncharacterized protein (DUF4415 family)
MKAQQTHPNPELIDASNPEWTDEMFKSAKRIDQLPAELQGKLRRQGMRGPQKAPTKIQTAIRYDRDVVNHFKAQGPGWQTRMNSALKKAILAGLA